MWRTLIWLALVLVMSLISALPDKLRAKLLITSIPWPCRVIVDGHEVGTTGASPLEVIVSPGTHVIKLIYTRDYEVLERGVTARAGEVLKLHLKLKLSRWGAYKRALKLYDEGEYEEVVKLLKPIAVAVVSAKRSDSVEPLTDSLFYLGASYLKLNKPNKGGYWLKQYLRREPNSLKARWLLAKAKAQLGYPDQAVRDLELILKEMPFLSQVYNQFYTLLDDMSKKELREIRKSLLDYLKHMSGENEILYKLKLAAVSKKIGDLKSAYSYMSDAIEKKVGNPWKP